MMIRFACPGCGWIHSANPSFIGMTARCVRCGTVIRVEDDPDADGEPVEGTDIGEQGFELTDTGEGTDIGEGTDMGEGSQLTDGTDIEGTDVEGTAIDPTDVESMDDEEGGPSKKLYYIGGALLILLLMGVGYFVLSGSPTPPTPTQTQPVPTPAPVVTAPTLKPAPPPPVKIYEPPIEMNASRLVFELDEDLAQAEAKYRTKTLILWGTVKSIKGQGLVLMEASKHTSTFRGLLRTQAVLTRPLLATVIGVPATLMYKEPEITDYQTLGEGTPITIRAKYNGGGIFSDIEILRYYSRRDDVYKGKVLTLLVPGHLTTIQFDEHNCVNVRSPLAMGTMKVVFRFKPKDLPKWDEEHVPQFSFDGRSVAIVGTCIGRNDRSVIFTDCRLATEPGMIVGDPMQAALFAIDYENDVWPFEPIDSSVFGDEVGPEALAQQAANDLQAARSKYLRKVLRIRGNPTEFDGKTKVIRFSVSPKLVDQGYSIKIQYGEVGYDEAVQSVDSLTGIPSFRCFCDAIDSGRIVLSGLPPTKSSSESVGVTRDFLPMVSPESPRYYNLLVKEGLQGPVIRRLEYRYAAPDEFHVTVTKHAYFKGDSLNDKPNIDWIDSRIPLGTAVKGKKSTPPNKKGKPVELPPFPKKIFRYRDVDQRVEIGELTFPNGPDQKPELEYDPLLKLGARTGEIWLGNTKSLPREQEGFVIQYRLGMISRNTQLGPTPIATVEVVKIITEPKAQNVTYIERTVYAQGIGEISWVLSRKTREGSSTTIAERRLVNEESSSTLETTPKPVPPSTKSTGK